MMEERIKISDVEWLQTELEKIERRLSALETARSGKNDAMVFDGKLWQSPKSTTPQPVRIRPDDMVMVKWVDLPSPKKLRFGDINVINNDQIEYISPIQPVRREWNEKPADDEIVWAYIKRPGIQGYVDSVMFGLLLPGDLWLPVLSPDEPAPDAPCEVGK